MEEINEKVQSVNSEAASGAEEKKPAQFDALMASSYNDLRHQEVIWADFADITQVDISLDGKDYTFTSDSETITIAKNNAFDDAKATAYGVRPMRRRV